MPTSVIDTDIHTVVKTHCVEKRLAQPFRLRFSQGNRGPGNLGYWNPNGVMRADAVIDGERIEEDPRLLGPHFFDKYSLEYGILNFTGALHFGLGTDPYYAAAVVTASNDAVVEEWLPEDERMYASIAVAPNDPAAPRLKFADWGI